MIRIALLEDEVAALLKIACRIQLIGDALKKRYGVVGISQAPTYFRGLTISSATDLNIEILPFLFGNEAQDKEAIEGATEDLIKELRSRNIELTIPVPDTTLGNLAPREAADRGKLIEVLNRKNIDLVISDSNIGDNYAGLNLFRLASSLHVSWKCLLITQHDHLQKEYSDRVYEGYDPCECILKDEILATTWNRNNAELGRILEDTLADQILVNQTRTNGVFGNIIGSTPPMLAMFRKILRYAASDATVLVTGPRGSGKELVAQEIYDRSRRRGKPFLRVNCGGIAPSLLESQLFGHVKGTFTGANEHRDGALQAAHEGTLFFDEVGNLSLEGQKALLRAMQSGEVSRVGSTAATNVDVRFICATNEDLPARIKDGTFRDDFYDRINVLTINVPPLCDRKEDIRLLARHFLRGTGKELSASALKPIIVHDWPDNVRGLQNLLEAARRHADGNQITLHNEALDRILSVFSANQYGRGHRSIRHGTTREERAAMTVEELLEGINDPNSGFRKQSLPAWADEIGRPRALQLVELAIGKYGNGNTHLSEREAQRLFGMNQHAFTVRVSAWRDEQRNDAEGAAAGR